MQSSHLRGPNITYRDGTEGQNGLVVRGLCHEMLPAWRAFLLTTLSHARAGDLTPAGPFRVHGHVLGETVADSAMKDGTSLDRCRELLTRKASRKEKQTSKLCQSFLSAAEGQETFVGPAYRTGGDSNFDTYPFSGEVKWSAFFAGGRLVHVTMTTQESSRVTLDSTAADLTESYGPPSEVKTFSHQNLMGATFTTIGASWDRPNGVISLWEDFFEGDLTTRTLRVDFVTRERAEYLKKLQIEAHQNVFH
jgi:hypothetical protein